MTSAGEFTSDDYRNAAMELVHGQSTLVLATSGKTGPWSAPVYYVCFEGSFYFFSAPQSRHIQQAMQSGQSAASLFSQADSWENIRGIQMTGRVKRIQSPVFSLKVIAIYLKRFPFTRDFFPNGVTPDLNAFLVRFQARLFAFTPTQVFYTDNRFGFGTRAPIDW